jgi:ketosteroid isomerase-like protein
MADYQPRLYGPAEALRFYEMLARSQDVARFVQQPVDLIAIGDDVVERGTFEIAFEPRGGGAEQSHPGRYVHLWRRQADGTYKLKAEAWGYAGPVADPASHTLGGLPAAGVASAGSDPAVAAELDALNAAEAQAVRDHDTARTEIYTPDAVLIPFADTPKVGIAAIREHLTRYIDEGAGATFDSVRVWNEGYEVHGPYVIEYPKFEVVWRAGADSGTVSGAGLHLWRREPDCSLKRLLNIGTHDHR